MGGNGGALYAYQNTRGRALNDGIDGGEGNEGANMDRQISHCR